MVCSAAKAKPRQGVLLRLCGSRYLIVINPRSIVRRERWADRSCFDGNNPPNWRSFLVFIEPAHWGLAVRSLELRKVQGPSVMRGLVECVEIQPGM